VITLRIDSGEVAVESAARPRRRAGFALLRLRLAGICNTDIELRRGYYGFAGRPGHEFVADVVECDSPQWLGKRVVGEINLHCGRCEWCARDLGRHCPRRSVLGIVKHPGAFAEYLTLPVSNLVEVPASMPDERAVFVEPLAAACEILEQVEVARGADVAVLGDGKLGLLIAQTLAAYGANVDQFGRHRHKLAISRKAGVRGRVEPKSWPLARYQLVVDATGSEAGLARAVSLTRPRGTVVCKSTVATRVTIDMAPVIVNEIRLIGSRCGRFGPAMRLLAGSEIYTQEMIEASYPLSNGVAAFAHAERRGTLKVLLTP
jgi:threonine dehydrogenase-like Zn-dependent dehydrogenase